MGVIAYDRFPFGTVLSVCETLGGSIPFNSGLYLGVYVFINNIRFTTKTAIWQKYFIVTLVIWAQAKPTELCGFYSPSIIFSCCGYNVRHIRAVRCNNTHYYCCILLLLVSDTLYYSQSVRGKWGKKRKTLSVEFTLTLGHFIHCSRSHWLAKPFTWPVSKLLGIINPLHV